MENMQNNKMINLGELINSCFNKNDIYIPLIQRNYKWDKKTAAKLASDLFRSFKDRKDEYTIGMITLYREESNKLQLIDGQQRIITLTLLLQYLKPRTQYYKFAFERDEGIEDDKIKRSIYLWNIGNIKIDTKDIYTDLERFQENFDAIQEQLSQIGYEENHLDEFIEFILKKVYILIHITDVEPVDEFLNINKNKTRFVISDYIKANLIIDTEKLENAYSRKEILDLFKELSNYFYAHNDIWELVVQGYDISSDENRLKVLFCDRYDGNSKLGYEAIPEHKRLKYYKKILKLMSDDIKNNNWNSYNGFHCIYTLKKTKFFEVFGKKYNEKILYKPLEKVLVDKIKKSSPYEKNCFIQSQLFCNKMNEDELKLIILSDIKSEFADKENWFYTAKDECHEFESYYEEYINEKYM